MNTPGGFHSFEHRWALPAAFAFQSDIGRADIEGRIHELNTQLKQGLKKIPRVRLHTPMAPGLSAGITSLALLPRCCEREQAVDELGDECA
jgi:isopenicillin-N epimerase